jgi:hypothetical protein
MVKFWFFGNADLINIFVSFGQYLSRYRENSVRIMSFYVLRCWPDNIAEKKIFFFIVIFQAMVSLSMYRDSRRSDTKPLSVDEEN